MQLIGREILETAKRKHEDVRKSLDVWSIEVAKAEWKRPLDIKKLYASASFLAENVVIFNIKGNQYRLEIKVNYSAGIVLVKWFGTHSEYDKRNRGRS